MKRAVFVRLITAAMAFCLPLIPNSATAQLQETKVDKSITAYRLEFNVRELEDGKRLNSRNYMMMAEEGSFGKIRVGNRLPIQNGQQIQYQNVGMNIDCRPREHESGVALEIVVDFSSVATKSQPTTELNAVFRTDRTEVQTVVAFGKPTLVTSFDDLESNRRYEIEVTATKVK